jgi:ubiquinone/menaquinone biosynthesis C-methylase UbiE
VAELDENLVAAGEMWGGADYELIARRFAPIHDELVSSLEPRAGQAWLDVATGTGEVALRAASAGADVSALDLAPALLDQARSKAAAEGLDVAWTLGDAQNLPYPDASFDVVVSNFGIIFAPEPEAAARELARVCRVGGRLGITGWEPNEGLHSLYARFAEDEADDPTERWGERESVERLLGDAFELEISRRVWHLEADSPEGAWRLISAGAPPVKALVESLEASAAEDLRAAAVAYWRDFETADGGVDEPRGYLLVLGRRR